MLGQTFPWIILVTPMFILFAKLGFLNNHISMIFCYVSVSLPFAIYLLVGYLESVPRELDEAALIDGCPQFQIIWKIIFPIMIPGCLELFNKCSLICSSLNLSKLLREVILTTLGLSSLMIKYFFTVPVYTSKPLSVNGYSFNFPE